MGRLRQVARSVIPAGSTRVIDLMLDPTFDASVYCRWRSGEIMQATVSSSASWTFKQGRRALAIASGLGNGWFPQFLLPITTRRPAISGALAARSGITRLICSMATGDLTGVTNANSDIGFDCLIGVPSGMSDLRTANNSHLPGTSGWGVLLMLSGKWALWVKAADTPSGTVIEATDLPADQQTALNSGEWTDIEYRIYDATYSAEAKMELYINSAKVLTRYWTNPAGVVTPQLPPLGIPGAGFTGEGVIPQLRNTSTGPPAQYFTDVLMVQGPNDAGTL